MKPVLYPKTERKYVDFGLGEISDALAIQVTRERNGDYSLYMKYPHDGIFAMDLQKEMQIKADAGARTKWQTFDIVRVNRKSTDYIEVYAKHVSFRLEGAVLKSAVAAKEVDARTALAQWKNNIVSDTVFDIDSDITTTGDISWAIDKVSNAREALGGVSGSILDIYGGEYEFDNQLVKLHKQLGRKAPIVLEYGRNIQEIEADDDDSEVFNSILPFAKISQQEGDKSIDVLTTLPELYIDGPFISNYQRRIIKQVDFSSKFDSEKNKPTEDKLRRLAKSYVKSNSVGKSKITIDVKYIDLASTLDYSEMQVMEEVELCDVLPLYYPKFGITSASEKVVKTVYDVYNDEYVSLTLGTIGQTIRNQLSESTSGRIDALENKQKQFESDLPTYLTNASGNRNWYDTPDGDVEHKIGDIWFEKNGLYDRMYVWDGSQWMLKIDTEDPDRIKRTIDQQFTDFNESYEAEQVKQDQAVKEVLAKANIAEDLAEEAKKIGDQAKLDAVNALTSAQTAKTDAIAEAKRLDTVERQATESKLATAKSQAITEAGKLVNTAKTTLESEISSANQAIADAKEALKSQISGVSTEITKTNDTIKTLATKTDVDTANKRLTTAETTIKQQAGQIAQKANQSTVDTLTGRVTTAETSLTQQADEIALKANASDVDTLTNRVSSAESSIKVNSNQIALKASQTDVNDVKTRLQSAESSLQVQAGEIASRVKTSDFNQATSRLNSAESSIVQLGNRITSEISETVAKIPNEIGGRNLLLNSDFENVEEGHSFTVDGQTITNTAKNWVTFNPGIAVAKFSYHAYVADFEGRKNAVVYNETNGSRNWKGIYQLLDDRMPQTTNNFILSADVFVTGAGTKLFGGFFYFDKSGSQTFHSGYFRFDTNSFEIGKWQRVSITVPFEKEKADFTKDIRFYIYGYGFSSRSILAIDKVKLETGKIPSDHTLASEDLTEDIENVKTTITQTAEGIKQLSTKVTESDSKISKAETDIKQLVGDVSSKVSQTEFNKLNSTVTTQTSLIRQQSDAIEARALKSDVDTVTGRVTSAETTIKTMAGQIETKLSRIDADKIVTNAIMQSEQGTIQRISEVEGKIPTSIGGRNLWIKKDSTGYSAIEKLPQNHITGQSECYRLKNGVALIFNIEPEFSSRLYGKVTFSAWVKYENVVQGANAWNVFNCFKHVMYRKNSKTGATSTADYTTLKSFTGTSDWQKITVTYDYGQDTNYDQLKTQLRFYVEHATSGTAWVTGIKVEMGSIATDYSLAIEDAVLDTQKFHEIQDTVDSHTRTISEQGKSISQVLQTADGIVTRVSSLETNSATKADVTNATKDLATQTQVNQLAGSWAVKNLTSAGTVLNQINLMANGTNRIDGRLTHITGSTLIDNAVIKDANIASLSASKMTTGTLDAGKVNVVNLNASNITSGTMTADKIKGGILQSLNGNSTFDLQTGNLSIKNRSMINLNGAASAIYRETTYNNSYLMFHDFESSSSGYNTVVLGANTNKTFDSNSEKFTGIFISPQNRRFYMTANSFYIQSVQGGGSGVLIENKGLETIIGGLTYNPLIIGKTDKPISQIFVDKINELDVRRGVISGPSGGIALNGEATLYSNSGDAEISGNDIKFAFKQNGKNYKIMLTDILRKIGYQV